MTMKEMAVEYRMAAVKMRMQIKRMEEEGAPPYDINQCRKVLQELRDTSRLLSSYYETPRFPPFAAVSWHAPKTRSDK